MKILIKDLGAIKKAELVLGDLTIICGGNNTGKTYATYATFGFLDYLRTDFQFKTSRDEIAELLQKGTVSLNLASYADEFHKHLSTAAKTYSKMLHRVFAGKTESFKNAAFEMSIDTIGNYYKKNSIKMTIGSAEKSVLQINKSPGSSELVVSLIVDKNRDDIPPVHFLEQIISDGIKSVMLESAIPRPFICSAERTGSAIFQKELDFTRNRLVELLGDRSSTLDPIQLLGQFKGEYPIPVRKNVDFIRELPNIINQESYILKHNPEILDTFADIIGGEYKVTQDGEIQYIPNSNKKIKLSMVESSSAVRSLLDIGFYLRHIAQPGDLLMIDEPELNLHPENQRRVARLFSRLVNLGIKIFITTHSDYIIKELNTMIMLNNDKLYLKEIAKQEGYSKDELLSADKIRVYIAEEALIKLDGKKRKTRCQTLTPADINQEMGIEVRSFDTTIDKMNQIQEEIVWGGDE